VDVTLVKAKAPVSLCSPCDSQRTSSVVVQKSQRAPEGWGMWVRHGLWTQGVMEQKLKLTIMELPLSSTFRSNLSYAGGRDQEDCGSISETLTQENPSQKKKTTGVVQGVGLSSCPTTTHTKKVCGQASSPL
jgi:hypothetical protein